MSSNGSPIIKENFLEQIWSISTTLTDEAMSAALNKANEMNFDVNRGIVPMRETFINLASARDTLLDAIEKRKLVQLPITVQREVLASLQAISKSLQGLAAGTDEIVNLTNGVENLNTSIWKYGLHNLSEEVLGYQTKLNQIKVLEVQVSQLLSELEAIRPAAESARTASDEIVHRSGEVQAALDEIKKTQASAGTLLDQIKATDNTVTALSTTIQHQEKQGGELTSNIRTANNEMLALEGSIKKFYGEVEEYRNKINEANQNTASLIRTVGSDSQELIDETTRRVDEALNALHKEQESTAASLAEKVESHLSGERAKLELLLDTTKTETIAVQKDTASDLKNRIEAAGKTVSKLTLDAQATVNELEENFAKNSAETIEANKQRTDLLIDELGKLKDQVRDQIQQATGFTLFGAFQARQNQIAKSKNFWVYAIATLVAISAAVTIWIAHEAQYYSANDFAFWIKLSLTLPLGFALTFCTVQYSRERRLEEEYAFKSSISVSLNPYRDLIHSMLAGEGAADQSKYTEFVIDSVRNVFTPPMDKVFEVDKKPGLTAKTFKQTAEIIGTAVKAAK